MKYKTLGNSGLLVSTLCLGTMTFGDGSGVYRHIGQSDQNDADDLIKTALDAGVNFLTRLMSIRPARAKKSSVSPFEISE